MRQITTHTRLLLNNSLWTSGHFCLLACLFRRLLILHYIIIFLRFLMERNKKETTRCRVNLEKQIKVWIVISLEKFVSWFVLSTSFLNTLCRSFFKLHYDFQCVSWLARLSSLTHILFCLFSFFTFYFFGVSVCARKRFTHLRTSAARWTTSQKTKV